MSDSLIALVEFALKAKIAFSVAGFALAAVVTVIIIIKG